MKVITWNVNSIRTRLDRVCNALERHAPDVMCLQELKTPDDRFPVGRITELGYHCEIFGQRGFNGVALLSTRPMEDVERGFDGNPIPEQARVISGVLDGVRIYNLYVVNGQTVDSEAYQTKLDWLSVLGRHLTQHAPDERILVVGDFNIAPRDIDVFNPQRWEGKVLCTKAERQFVEHLSTIGLTDLYRALHPETVQYTWWDYRGGAFRRNWGLRIDLLFGSPPMLECCTNVYVDQEERKADFGPGKPSDHAPVIGTFSP